MKARFGVATTIITLAITSLSSAQTNSWSWVRQDHVLNPSGLEVGNFNAQFDVLDWNGDGLWDFIVNNDVTLQLFVGIEAAQGLRWQKQLSSFPALETNYYALYEPLAFQFVDFDHDGDFDLAADGGQFWWNTGSNANPAWTKDDSVLFDLREQGNYVFVDYNDDGDWEAIADYNIYSGPAELFWSSRTNTRVHWFADTTEISAPLEGLFKATYRDFDGDADLDLVGVMWIPVDPIGCVGGHAYINTGTREAPLWEEQPIGAGYGLIWCSYGLPIPSYQVVDFDNDGKADILFRDSSRQFEFFKNQSRSDSLVFDQHPPVVFGPIMGQANAIPFLFDYRQDQSLDLIVSEEIPWDFVFHFYSEGRFVSFASVDGKFDVNNPDNGWFKNPYPVQVANFAKQFHLNFNDFDRDGDSDYLFSYYRMATFPQDTISESRVIFFRNLGPDSAPNWTADSSLFAQFDKSPELFWAPNLIDIDNDGEDELFIKRREDFFFYEQVAAGPPWQWQVKKSFMSGIRPSNSHYLAVFADLTRDGLPDLIFGEDNGTLSFYENIGDPHLPAWLHNPQTFANIDVGELAAPAFGDMDHDGRLDMFIGSADGRLFFYRNESTVGVEETPHEMPLVFQLSNNYPNPFAAQNGAFATTFDFHLPRASRVRVRIYNLLGQEIRTLLDDHLQSGRHHIQWDGRDHCGQIVGAGIYLVSLRAGDLVQARKLILIR